MTKSEEKKAIAERQVVALESIAKSMELIADILSACNDNDVHAQRRLAVHVSGSVIVDRG